MDLEEERQRKVKPIAAYVEQLAGMIAEPALLAGAAAVQQVTPPPPVDPTAVIPMETGQTEAGTEEIQGDDPMGGEDGAQDKDKEDAGTEKA